MKVFDHEIPRGEKAFFGVPAGEYANRAKVELPVMVIRGKKDGPVFWINGEVHGEEINGSAAAWEFALELDPAGLKGTVVITPVANPIAFVDRIKVSQIDYLDMDTTFPGNPNGQWTQKLAYILFEEIKDRADYLLSMHSQATKYAGNPYTVFKKVPGADPEISRVIREMALSFGLEPNCLVDLETATGELHGVTSGALDITCILRGIPAFMTELGPGGRITRPFVEQTKTGLRNVLIHLGMLEGTAVKCPRPQILITKRTFLRSPWGGMMKEICVKPGDIVRKGEAMARFHYFTDEVWEYDAPCDCFIINSRQHPVVNTGERIAFVGTQWHTLEE